MTLTTLSRNAPLLLGIVRGASHPGGTGTRADIEMDDDHIARVAVRHG